MHALGDDVAGGDVLHHARRAAALGVDQEVRARVRGARGFDVGRADAGVDVALAVPDVHAPAELLLDVGAEPHVGAEQDLGVRAVRLVDVAHDVDGVGRGAAVVGQRLDLGGRVDVHHDDALRVLRAPVGELLGVDRGGQRAAGVEVGDQHGLLGAQDRGGLGHEVHAAEDDRLAARRRPPGARARASRRRSRRRPGPRAPGSCARGSPRRARRPARAPRPAARRSPRPRASSRRRGHRQGGRHRQVHGAARQQRGGSRCRR